MPALTLRARTRAPILQVAKSAVAAIAAWLLADWLIPGPVPVFAAIAALLVVQPSVTQSYRKAVERTAGVVIGVAVASLLGIVLGEGTAVIFAAIVAALATSWLLRLTIAASSQVAVSALLVLALGPTTPNYAIDRVLETLFGAVIGFIVNIVVAPPLAIAPARRAVAELAAALAGGFDHLADALATPATASQLDALIDEARAARPLRAAAQAALDTADESLSLNPRGWRRRGDVDELRRVLERLTSVVIQFGGMCGTVRERYDATVPADPAVAVIVAELRRVADGVRSIREHLEDERDAAAERTSPPPALDAAGAVPGAHWVLVGSLQVDLQRVGGGLARLGARS